MYKYKIITVSILLAALSVFGFLGADSDKEDEVIRASQISVYGLELDSITARIARSVRAGMGPSAEKTPLIVWLLDNTKFLKKSKCAKLISSAIEKTFGKDNKCKLMIVKYAITPEIITEPTKNIKDVTKGINSVFKATDDSYKDPFSAVRFCIEKIKDYPNKKKHIVIFTIENNDLESDLEGTLALLRENNIMFSVISGGAMMCNPDDEPYGEIPADSPKGTKVYRAESAELELEFVNPHLEWWYPKSRGKSKDTEYYKHKYPYYNTFVFSGYGIYGLSRLAAYTGGKYYFYYPPLDGKGSSFCQEHVCLWCSRKDKKEHTGSEGCVTSYQKVLPVMSPVLISRDDYNYKYASDPFFLMLGKIKANNCGWLSTGLPSMFDSEGNFSRGYNFQVNKQFKDIDKMIKKVEELLAEDHENVDKRMKAHVEVCLANLYVEKFALTQQKGFIENLKVEKTENGSLRVFFECLCHLQDITGFLYPEESKDGYIKGNLKADSDKIKSFIKKHNMEIYGGEEGEAAFIKALEVCSRIAGKYKNTPWELVVRRIPILVKLTVRYSAPGPNTTTQKGTAPPPKQPGRVRPGQTGSGRTATQTGK